jgi:hypothetical protein
MVPDVADASLQLQLRNWPAKFSVSVPVAPVNLPLQLVLRSVIVPLNGQGGRVTDALRSRNQILNWKAPVALKVIHTEEVAVRELILQFLAYCLRPWQLHLPGHETHDVCSIGVSQKIEALSVRVANRSTKYLSPRPKRWSALPIPAPAPYHTSAASACFFAEFLRQPCFANSRLAANQEQTACARQHIRQPLT